MIANYHTHTVRCGHAAGKDREYAEKALERGIRLLGFSEHIPMPYPDGHEDSFRLPLKQLDDYVSSVLQLREEYRGRLQILLGFEAEYYPDLLEALLAKIAPYPVDYLLLGQHFNSSAQSIYNTRPQNDAAALSAYVDAVLEGLGTGLFLYAAHPDLFHFTGEADVYRREMRRLCEGAKALDIPLELNMLGLREARNYPRGEFWEIVSEVGNRVVLGCDAHDPDHVARPDNEKEALAFLERCRLEPEASLEPRPPFRPRPLPL